MRLTGNPSLEIGDGPISWKSKKLQPGIGEGAKESRNQVLSLSIGRRFPLQLGIVVWAKSLLEEIDFEHREPPLRR